MMSSMMRRSMRSSADPSTIKLALDPPLVSCYSIRYEAVAIGASSRRPIPLLSK